MNESLIPKAFLLQKTWQKLTSILADFETYTEDFRTNLVNNYDIDEADADQIIALIDSFGLGELHKRMSDVYRTDEDFNKYEYFFSRNEIENAKYDAATQSWMIRDFKIKLFTLSQLDQHLSTNC